MNHIDSVVGAIISVITDPVRSHDNKKKAIKYLVKGYAGDSMTVLNNINKTSLNDTDREQRIADLCKQTGMYKSGDNFY